MSSTDYIRTSDRSPIGLILLIAALLAIVTAVVFSAGLGGGFIYDDVLLVGDAPATQSIAAAFQNWLEPYWGFERPDSETQRGLWRPMASLALAVGRTVAGGEPFGFHVVSLLLHIAATWACYRLAANLLRRRLISHSRAEYAAAIIALIFAIHPAQVEAVSWISAVNDPLWGLFGLLALHRYEVAAHEENLPLAAALLFALALMCKEHAVVVLPLAVLLDLSGHRRPRFGRLALMCLPLVAWFSARVLVFDSADAGIFRGHGDFGMTATRELGFRFELVGGFLERTFWPVDPAVFRPVHPVLPEGSNAVLSGAIWLGVAVFLAALSWRRGRRIAAFGLVGLLVVIAPIVATPDRAGLFPLSDRYLYVGIACAALTVGSILSRFSTQLPLIIVGALVPAVFAPITWNDQARFESELVFRTEGVHDAPNNPNALWGAGRAYVEEYQRTLDVNFLRTAYLYYLHSLRAGTIYGDGSFVDDTSLPMAKRAMRLEQLILETPPEERRPDPTVMWDAFDRLQATLGQITVNFFLDDLVKGSDLQYPLDVALQAKLLWPEEPALDTTIAQLHERRGEFEAAKESIGLAIQRAPSNGDNYKILGRILLREGDLESARMTLQRGVDLDPNDDDIRIELATVALEGRRFEIAERELDVVLARTGRTSVRALVLRAALENRRELPSEALRWLDQALAIDPDNGAAHKERGLASAKLGDVDGAIGGFSKACEQLPEDFEAHYNFAALMLQQRPPGTASRESMSAWEETVTRALVRAYVLSPRTGEEQLLLQRQIEPFLRGSPDAAFNLAMTLNEQRRDVLALFWLQRVVEWRDQWAPEERAKNLVHAFTTSGDLYKQAGKPDEALDAFKSAVLTDPNNFRARFELGDLYYLMGEPQAAKPHLERALELFPDAGIAPEMQAAVRGTVERRLEAIAQADGQIPLPPPEDPDPSKGDSDQ